MFYMRVCLCIIHGGIFHIPPVIWSNRTVTSISQLCPSNTLFLYQVHPQPETYWGNVNTLGPRACYDEGKRIAETMCYAYAKQVKTKEKEFLFMWWAWCVFCRAIIKQMRGENWRQFCTSAHTHTHTLSLSLSLYFYFLLLFFVQFQEGWK